MRRRLLEVALAGALGSLAGAALVGAHDADTSKLHGCYPAGGGVLLLIEPGGTCPAGYDTAVDWAKTGPAGPQGPAGSEAGPAGPPGPPGPAGAGFTFRTAKNGPTSSNNASCASDEIALGGGHSLGHHHLGFNIEWSHAFTRSWSIGSNLASLETYVVCAKRRDDLELPVVPRP